VAGPLADEESANRVPHADTRIAPYFLSPLPQTAIFDGTLETAQEAFSSRI
jgi:hypothetical protein